MPRKYVFRNAEIRDQREVLVDDADAGSHRISRAREVDWTAQESDLACVGRIKTGNELDQRAFARAIRAEQGMDFAGSDVEIDSVERHDAGKGFSQTANAENIVLPREAPRLLECASMSGIMRKLAASDLAKAFRFPTRSSTIAASLHRRSVQPVARRSDLPPATSGAAAISLAGLTH